MKQDREVVAEGGRPPRRGRRRLRPLIAGGVAAGLWAAFVVAWAAGYYGLLGGEGARPLTALEAGFCVLAALLPAALILFAAMMMERLDAMRRQAVSLETAVAGLREALAPRNAPGAAQLADAMAAAARESLDAERSAMARIIAELTEAQRLVKVDVAELRAGHEAATGNMARMEKAQEAVTEAARDSEARLRSVIGAAGEVIAELARLQKEALSAKGDLQRTAEQTSGAAEELRLTREAVMDLVHRIETTYEITASTAERLQSTHAAASTLAEKIGEAGAKLPLTRLDKGQRRPPPPAEEEEQPDLPLRGAPSSEGGDIDWMTVAKALDFPRDENDKEGFAALRKAVRSREVSSVLQAAEDTLTILAQDGLFMEDVGAEIAPLDIWRAYLDGERGPKMAAIGGVVDEVALALARGRMRSDPIFRDTSLHLIRRFDGLLRRAFAEAETEEEVRALIDTRTGRAFMLCARIMGAFD